MNCGTTNWNEDMIVTLRFKQFQTNPSFGGGGGGQKKKFGTLTGFEPKASALALQCSTKWAMKTHTLHTLGAGQFVEFILTRERNETERRAPNVWVFIAQSVEHCSANTVAMFEIPKLVFQVNLQLPKFQLPLRWSYLHLITSVSILLSGKQVL